MASSQKDNYKIKKLFQWIIALIVAVAISFWIKTSLTKEQEEKSAPPTSTEQTQTTDLPSVVFLSPRFAALTLRLRPPSRTP